MHTFTLFALLPLAAAFPLSLPSLRSLLQRDLTSDTQNDLTDGYA